MHLVDHTVQPASPGSVVPPPAVMDTAGAEQAASQLVASPQAWRQGLTSGVRSCAHRALIT